MTTEAADIATSMGLESGADSPSTPETVPPVADMVKEITDRLQRVINIATETNRPLHRNEMRVDWAQALGAREQMYISGLRGALSETEALTREILEIIDPPESGESHAEAEATEPEATEPEATEPEATEPEATASGLDSSDSQAADVPDESNEPEVNRE